VSCFKHPKKDWHIPFAKQLFLLFEMDTEPPCPLLVACFAGNLFKVKQLLPCRVESINQESADVGSHSRSTPLIAAIAQNHPEITSHLLAHAADPNLGVFHGIFPLGIAAEKGRLDTCYRLLQAGALHSPAFGLTLTPIQLAVRAGHLNVVELLLAFGADLHGRTADGTSLAVLAAREGHATVIAHLVGAGVDVNVWRSGGSFLDGWAPLDVAANNGHLEAVETLLGCKADPNLVINTGRQVCQLAPLVESTRNNRFDIVRALLVGGAEPDTSNNVTPNALTVAARVGNIPIARLLLEHSASIDNFSCNQNPLIASAYAGNEAMTQMLVDNGADVKKQSPSGGATATYYAAEQGHIKTLTILLKAGASPNHTIYRPPIFAAVQNNQIDVMFLLAIWGANVKVRDLGALAYRVGSPTVSVLFRSIVPSVVNSSRVRVFQQAWSPLVIAIASRSVRECRLALKFGAFDPDVGGTQSIAAARKAAEPNPWGAIDTTAEMNKFAAYFVDHAGHPERCALERMRTVVVCPETTLLVRLATRGWKTQTHWLHHGGFRQMVQFVLLLANRLENNELTLPRELWLLIPTLLSRSCVLKEYSFK
jgi:ankyrin repeat protein